ncbi:MAG: hypothetical protein FWH14_02135 [Oscillospiraceae bacterium]|nr:hypothetical protein [Oscillospiraceae bacterium]
MNTVYRYNPDDFKGILGLSDDFSNFYKSHEKYCSTNALMDWSVRHNCWENLIFTIKGREVEGFLNPVTAHEMTSYLEELVID